MNFCKVLTLMALWGLVCLPTIRTSKSEPPPAGATVANDARQISEAQEQHEGSAAQPTTDPLPDGAIARLGSGRPGGESHVDAVTSIAWAPNGTMIASGGDDGDLRLWNSQTGRMTRKLPFSNQWVRALTFSPDGITIAATGDEQRPTGFGGVITVYKPDGTIIWSKSSEDRGMVLAFSEDGEAIAVAGGSGRAAAYGGGEEKSYVTIYAARSGKPGLLIEGFEDRVIAMRFSADGTALRIVQSNEISTWNMKSGKKQSSFFPIPPHGRIIHAAAFTPDSNIVATSSLDDDQIILWNVTNGEQLRRIRVENAWGSSLAFSGDGELLASVSAVRYKFPAPHRDTTVYVWDRSTGARLAQFSPVTDPAPAVAFMPNGDQLVTGMADGTVLVWKLAERDI